MFWLDLNHLNKDLFSSNPTICLQGGKGYAQNIIFQNIVMDNVTNPIIIDQNYCDQKEPCKQQVKTPKTQLSTTQSFNIHKNFLLSILSNTLQADAVQVSNVIYQNIRGTSASEVAVKFDCSKSLPCQGVILQDINLVHRGKQDDKSAQAEASCKNVKLKNRGRVSPQCAGRRTWRRRRNGGPNFANARLGHCKFK